MRGKETWLLAFILGTGVLVSYKWLGSSSPMSLPALLRREPTRSSVTAFTKPSSDTASHKAGAHNRVRSGSAGRSSGDITLDNIPLSTITVEVPGPLFPTRENLRIGTSSSQMRAIYGPPAMSAATIRDGRVLERSYYVNADRTKITVATLENGFVTRAQSLSNPYFELHASDDGSRSRP
jgi:hypothetical protein